MLKLLLLVSVLVGVYYFFFKKKSIASSTDSSPQADTMIPCTKCNTYVLPKEALIKEGKPYCSRECMEG